MQAFNSLVGAHNIIYKDAPLKIKPYLEGAELANFLSDFNDRRIFILNLHKQSSAEDVYELFSTLAPLENVNIRENRGKSENTCVILFRSKEDALRAFEYVRNCSTPPFAGI